MNLAELVTEVYAYTSRPDLVAKTLSAVKAATLKMHHSDYYGRDLIEQEINFASALNYHTYDYTVGFPQFRALKYLRYLDKTVTPNVKGDFFQIIEPEQIVDGYNVTRENIVYLSGAALIIKALTEFRYGWISYYKHPVITDGGYTSWIAVEHPYAIVYEAARTICKFVGKLDSAASLEKSLNEELALLKITAVQLRGY